MIDGIQIENFKRFARADFGLRPLTVLTGVNGGGKSTVLQSLLLTRMAAEARNPQTIRLNGPYHLDLGMARGVLNWSAAKPEIVIRLRDRATDRSLEFRFGVPDQEEALHLVVDRLPIGAAAAIGKPNSGFTYLCAERLGPRDLLSVSGLEPDHIGVGVQGEFTAQVLALRETRAVSVRSTVREPLRHPGTASKVIRLQAEAWASEIVRPIRITAQLAPGIMASTIRFQEPGSLGEPVRPANTGFGVSYALPIIVAGLLTEPGDMIIVENPEAHLHPAGQSRLGRFLAKVAGSGVQVLVETHSDHVLNGARLAVAQDRTLNAADMIVHYFGDEETFAIEVDDRGDLGHWPAGFFDQIESDLGRLARARRAR
jgi:predicted ATPase